MPQGNLLDGVEWRPFVYFLLIWAMTTSSALAGNSAASRHTPRVRAKSRPVSLHATDLQTTREAIRAERWARALEWRAPPEDPARTQPGKA
jgi:hypothetical protein